MEDVNISENISLTPERSIQIIEDEPVGFDDDAKCIIELLIRGTKELDIIPILGMAGLGKTTLAKKIFKDPLIVSHFDVRAWATISQSYDVRELLKDIYRQVTGDKCNVHDIADMLRRCLMGRRYLIVLDDVWEAEAWNKNLRLSFPDIRNGSRIMLTTRIEQVARQVKCYTNPYSLRFLTMEESWELLQKKAFQNETCPHELRDVGLKLTQLCKGLPLTIVVIGGIISKRQRNVSEWSEVANNFDSHVGVVENEEYLAIHLSYRYLPVHLRHCLLTIGVFREDEKIVVSRLMLLWIAEGFIQYSDETKLEEVAEGYLMDLISSSLIMVSKMTFDGKVKYLQIHDLVRDFCLKRAKEEKFMQVIGSHNKYQSSHGEEQRVCIHLKDKLYKHFQTDFGVSLDAILTCNPLEKKFTSLFVTIESIVTTFSLSSSLGAFRLLRVFDLPACRLKDYENILQSLVHLRYLRMCCDEFFFEWVSHLCYLETLVVKSKELVTDGTPHIWRMTKLRHVNVGTILPLRVVGTSEEHTSKLLNLKTFQSMYLYEHDIKSLAASFPNLQQLLLRVLIDSDESECDLRLEVLTQLQTLSLYFGGRFMKFYFPSSLKELILHEAYISKYVTTTIAEIPNLTRLVFVECIFENDEWDVRDVEFPSLKFLKLRKVDLSQWHVSDSSFAMLEKLELIHCRNFEKIPHSFMDVITLKSIKVISCSPFLGDSALDVKKEVEEITGCDILQVYVFRHLYRGTADDLTADQISMYQETFQLLRNEYFRITTEELKTIMRLFYQQNPTESELKDIINEFDVDGDASLDFWEFLNMIARMTLIETLANQEMLKQMFSRLDEDHDGFISAAELRLSLTTLGDTKLTEEEINERIRKAVVGDGNINRKEFIKAMMPKNWKQGPEQSESTCCRINFRSVVQLLRSIKRTVRRLLMSQQHER